MLTTDPRTGTILLRASTSELAHAAYVRAHEFAREYDHEYLGTEHLLLGLLNGHNTATRALWLLDVEVFCLESMVRVGMVRGLPMVTTGKLPRTPLLKEVFDRAFGYAIDEGHHLACCHHLLRALLEGRESAVQLIMTQYYGLTADAVRDTANLIIAGAT